MNRTSQNGKYAAYTTENNKIKSSRAENNQTEKNKAGNNGYVGTVCEIQRNNYQIKTEIL